ncbi:hypothetical protein ABIE53_001540 [Burkholderia sp. OAS925]
MSAGYETRMRGARFSHAHALHIVARTLTWQFGFERFGIFVGARQQQLEAHADLLQQLLTARTLRREIDERMQRGSGRWHNESRWNGLAVAR